MKQFDFRLKKVLEYRRLTEEWAKEAYLEARSARLEAEIARMVIEKERYDLFNNTPRTINELLSREQRLELLQARHREQSIVIEVLIEDEARALAEWNARKQDVQALEKLHDKAFSEWMYEVNREEQAFLDEWTNGRRAA
ncbi:MAG: flagellar FliJ family protein [Methanoregulaceae archaeon]|nr:flagellar FliJ family protein [Methanoregulaceae archaeon]